MRDSVDTTGHGITNAFVERVDYDALLAENQRLRDALERLAAEPCEMAFVLEEIGRPEKDCREAYTNEQWCAPCIAREALAGDTE